jgi:hypothetical protein
MQRGSGFRKSVSGRASVSRRSVGTRSPPRNSVTLGQSYYNPVPFSKNSRVARQRAAKRARFACCASRRDSRPRQPRRQSPTFSSARRVQTVPGQQHYGQGQRKSKGHKSNKGHKGRKSHKGHKGHKGYKGRTVKHRNHFGAYYVAPVSRVYVVEDYVAEPECRQLTEHGYDADGRRVLVTWTLCFDEYGEPYVPADGRHVLALY